MIISEAKISSTAARRSKFKVACQMEACAGSSKLSGAVCKLSSHHPNLLIKQNTCGSIQTLRRTESLSYGNLWKSREEEQIQTPHLLHILAQIQLASLQSMENECWLLNGWLKDIYWKHSWTFFPLSPDSHSKQSWARFAYSILGTGKGSVFPVGQSFILFESDWFSEKCVFIREDMAHGKENPKHLTLSYNLSYSLVSYGWRPRRIIKVGARGQLESQLNTKQKWFLKVRMMPNCSNAQIMQWNKCCTLGNSCFGVRLCLSQVIKCHLLTSIQRSAT